jgi:hypothetical protein
VTAPKFWLSSRKRPNGVRWSSAVLKARQTKYQLASRNLFAPSDHNSTERTWVNQAQPLPVIWISAQSTFNLTRAQISKNQSLLPSPSMPSV